MCVGFVGHAGPNGAGVWGRYDFFAGLTTLRLRVGTLCRNAFIITFQPYESPDLPDQDRVLRLLLSNGAAEAAMSSFGLGDRGQECLLGAGVHRLERARDSADHHGLHAPAFLIRTPVACIAGLRSASVKAELPVRLPKRSPGLHDANACASVAVDLK